MIHLHPLKVSLYFVFFIQLVTNLQGDGLLSEPLMHISCTKAREIPTEMSQSWLRTVDSSSQMPVPSEYISASQRHHRLFSEALSSDVCERQDIRADGPSVLSNR